MTAVRAAVATAFVCWRCCSCGYGQAGVGALLLGVTLGGFIGAWRGADVVA